ncbi:MAG TPA: hypothetical protein VKU84_17355, partial [Stellaceae bacterium]|nr:hypothetical protein [Stellaceae bacterium]
MSRPLIVLALLTASMCACGRESAHRAPAATTPAAASVSQAPAPATGTAQSGTKTTAAAEAEPEGISDEPGTASLERLAALPPQHQLPDGRWKSGVNY